MPRPPRPPLLAAALLTAAALAAPAAAQIPGLPDGLKLPDGPPLPDAEPQGPPAPEPVWTGTVDDRVTALAFDPDGERLAVGTFEAVELFAAADGAAVRTLKTRSGFAEALLWTEPGVLTVGDYRRVTTWDPGTGRGIAKRTGPRGYVTGLALAGDALFAAAEDGTVRRWGGDEKDATVVQPLGAEARTPARGLAAHGNRIAVAFGDPDRDTKPGPAFLLDAATLETRAPLPEHARAAECAAFGADGRHVLTGGADEVGRLSFLPPDLSADDGAAPQPIGRYTGHARPLNAALGLPSPDAAPTFATGSGGRAKDGNELRVWRFEPDGEQVKGEKVENGEAEGGGGPAGTVRSLAAIADFAGPVRSLALSANGALLAVGDDAGAVRVYRTADLTAEPNDEK